MPIGFGEVKSKESTNLLIGVLSDTNLEYAYQAAVALGDIWEKSPATTPEVQTVNSAPLLAETIRRIHGHLSVSALFD